MPALLAAGLSGQRRVLRGLLATGAGYARRGAKPGFTDNPGAPELTLIYCVEGQGWCRISGQTIPVGPGELLAMSSQVAVPVYGPDRVQPWTIHWARGTGDLIAEYAAELRLPETRPLLRMGDDLGLVLLFKEILMTLAKGFTIPHVIHASQAFGLLLARCIDRQENPALRNDGFQKIGECIEFMSEHLSQPMKVGQLARLANLSAAHFAVVFKEQTGSSPREYLHLLRMHRAGEWLVGTQMPLKEIANRLGYQDQFHFSRKFKAFSGQSPSRYRESTVETASRQRRHS